MGEISTLTPDEKGAAFDQTPPPGDDSLILGKFKSQEDLAAAYQELEKKVGAPKEEPAPEQKPEEKAPEAKKEDAPSEDEYVAPLEKTDEDRTFEKQAYGDALAGLFDAAGIHAKSISDHFSKTGKFPESAYEALAAQGVSRGVVDQYLKGGMDAAMQEQASSAKEQEAQAILNRESEKQIMDSIGGQEAYQRMAQWADAALPKEEQDTFNRIMDSGNKDAISWAVRGLAQRYTKAMGSPPKLVRGGAPTEVSGFASWSEVTAAMAKPEYKTSPTYRDEVAKRMARSTNLKR